ncbi:MAG: ABC transporter substrate-binding protein [Pseudomonadota bacterium]
MNLMQKPGTAKWLILILGIGVLGLILWLARNKDTARPSGPPLPVTIASPTQISGGALYVSQDQNLFAKHGLNITIQPFILGKQALQSTLQGKADLAIVADTPFMFAIMHGEKIATISTIFGSRKSLAIAARRDRNITKAEDLAGKTIGTIFGINAQFFLDTLLLTHGIAKSSVTVVDLKPDTLVEALESGKVDAVTLWNPDLSKVESELGDQVVTIYDKDIFVYRFMLVGTQDYIAKHPAEIRQVLAAFAEGTRFIHEQPEQAQAIIGKHIGLDTALLSKSFDPNDFYLTLDQTLLLALGDQTRWAMKQNIIPKGDVPNYLNYIRQEPLESVLPSAVKIIH